MDTVFMFESMGKGDQNRRLIFALARASARSKIGSTTLSNQPAKGKSDEKSKEL
jgi:hypothetical protein